MELERTGRRGTTRSIYAEKIRPSMAGSNRWIAALQYLSPIALLLVLTQYLLGLGTNVYGPPTGFTENSSNPWLNAHFLNGDVLFLVGVVTIILAGISKVWRLLIPSVGLVVSVFVAGEFGMAYIGSTPNNAAYSYGMGVAFLFALFSAMALMMMSWSGRSRWMQGPTSAAATPQ
jgi:hypothetical protein